LFKNKKSRTVKQRPKRQIGSGNTDSDICERNDFRGQLQKGVPRLHAYNERWRQRGDILSKCLIKQNPWLHQYMATF